MFVISDGVLLSPCVMGDSVSVPAHGALHEFMDNISITSAGGWLETSANPCILFNFLPVNMFSTDYDEKIIVEFQA